MMLARNRAVLVHSVLGAGPLQPADPLLETYRGRILEPTNLIMMKMMMMITQDDHHDHDALDRDGGEDLNHMLRPTLDHDEM